MKRKKMFNSLSFNDFFFDCFVYAQKIKTEMVKNSAWNLFIKPLLSIVPRLLSMYAFILLFTSFSLHSLPYLVCVTLFNLKQQQHQQQQHQQQQYQTRRIKSRRLCSEEESLFSLAILCGTVSQSISSIASIGNTVYAV